MDVKTQKSPRTVVYQNEFSRVFSQKVDFGDFSKQYFVTDFGIRTGLLITRGRDVLLTRQYRLLIDGLSWEIPGGKAEKAESPEVSAVRETYEETGIQCRNLKLLLRYNQTLEAVKTEVHLFYTGDFDQEEFTPNPKEVARIEWVPFTKALQMIDEGEISDSFTILALFAYKIKSMENVPY